MAKVAKKAIMVVAERRIFSSLGNVVYNKAIKKNLLTDILNLASINFMD